MNKLFASVAAAAAFAAVGGGAYWLGGKQAAADAPKTAVPGAPAAKPGGQGSGAPGTAPGTTPQGPPPQMVEAALPTKQLLPASISTVGTLRSDESIMVRPEIAGRIGSINFREGQRVARGSTLFKLDAALQLAEVEQARANSTLARSKYERAIDLQKKGFISPQALDEAQNNLKVAAAALTLSEARMARTEIRAPFNGIVGLRSVSLGDYVREGQDLVNLEEVDPLKADFRVPEIHLSQVQAGQTLQVTLDALPGKNYEGRVLAINPQLDANGRAIVIRAVIKNSGADLRPGMFARVRLLVDETRESLLIPEEAVFPVGEDKFVFRIVDGRAQRQKVDIGQRRDGKVEILAGLQPVDRVVTQGQLKIRDGAPVRTAELSPKSAANPAAKNAEKSAPQKPLPDKAASAGAPAAR
jgi:membrane fusion protein, multidrug efflux system